MRDQIAWFKLISCLSYQFTDLPWRVPLRVSSFCTILLIWSFEVWNLIRKRLKEILMFEKPRVLGHFTSFEDSKIFFEVIFHPIVDYTLFLLFSCFKTIFPLQSFQIDEIQNDLHLQSLFLIFWFTLLSHCVNFIFLNVLLWDFLYFCFPIFI